MKLAKYLAVAAIVAFCVNAQPAQATDFVKTLLQQFSGTVTSWDDLDSRRSALEEQIRHALESGSLNLNDADTLRTQLNPVSDALIQGRASGRPLSFTQGLNYSKVINSVTASLQQAMEIKQSALPDVDALQLELSQRIDQALNANELAADDASKLKDELHTVGDIENTIKTTGDGTLSAKQVETISSRLSAIKTQLAQAVKIGQSAIPELIARALAIQKRITAALAEGRIDPKQGQDLQSDLDQSVSQMKTFTGASQYLNGKQILQLAGGLDQVSTNLQIAMGQGQPLSKLPSLSSGQIQNQNQSQGLIAPAAQRQSATIDHPIPQTLKIDNVEVSPTGNLSGGDVVSVRAFGSTDALATFSFTSGPQGIPMEETRDGVYEGSYTVRKIDNIGATHVFVSLSKDGVQPASSQARSELMLDALPPEVQVEPGPNASVTVGKPNLVVRFADGHGSGVDPASVHLIVNGLDVTPQAVVDSGVVAYKPLKPLVGTVSAEIRAADRCGNAVDYSWKFNAPPQPNQYH